MFFENPEYCCIAHRGLHCSKLEIPENSIEAFEECIKYNFPIELDVMMTKDKRIIVFHDINLKRMTGCDKLVSECTYSEISNLRLDDTESHIPLFSDVLNTVNGSVPLLIEIKNDKLPSVLEKKLVKMLGEYKGELAVQSFNPLVILWLRIFARKIKRGQLSSGGMSCFLRNMVFNFITKPDFISYRFNDIGLSLFLKAKRNNIPLICWTVRNMQELEHMRKYCKGYIFENIKPKQIKTFLQNICIKK